MSGEVARLPTQLLVVYLVHCGIPQLGELTHQRLGMVTACGTAQFKGDGEGSTSMYSFDFLFRSFMRPAHSAAV